MIWSRLLLFTFFMGFQFSLFTQTGPHPGTIKWRQINTENARVIFPTGFEDQGNRVANIIDYLAETDPFSLGDFNQQIQLVVHNQTVIPNGFVGIAPFRSEFYATPPQSANYLGTVDWLDALAIHEYRHVRQFTNARVGITKLFYYLQGENGWGLLSGASIPSWFWEGDATFMETALTRGGRGRAPFFTLEQRATLLNNRSYSYQKARNRSFKDLVPNHYKLGYAMVSYGQEKFGKDLWQPVFEGAARYKPLLYSFSNKLKKNTGLKTKDLYSQTYRHLKEKWIRQVNQLDLSPVSPINLPIKKTITHYRYPYHRRDGSIICLKSSFKKTDALVQIRDGKEKVLTTIGFHLEKYLSITGGKAVWTEYERDPRRRNKNFSNIVFYDFKTGLKRRLTEKKRYFSPDFSHSEGRIVTVQISPEQKNNLVILNGKNGELLRIIPNKENYFISFPKWAENDTDIVYIGKKDHQLAIFKYNLINRSTVQLSPWTHHTMADLFVKDQVVYFTASFSGLDNIFSVPLDGSSKIKALTSVKIGAYYPSVSVDQETLIFSEFTDMGFTLSSLPFSTASSRSATMAITEPDKQSFYPINKLLGESADILSEIPERSHTITPYQGFWKGLKLHSWNFTPSVSLPTLDIQVDNILGDLSMNFIGGYNFNEKAPVFVAAASYGKWYPLITGFTSLTNRSANYLNSQDSLAIQKYDQFSAGGRLSVPLSWVKGNYQTVFNPYLGYVHRFINNGLFDEQQRANFSLGFLQLGFNVQNIRRTALQNMGPRWGQTLNVSYQQSLESNSSRKINLGTDWYFPGIGPNHNLKLGLTYQRELLENDYQFSDAFEYPRGFGALLNDAFLKVSADYQFPLLYPDLGIWGITYFKRISLNLFFDYGKRKVFFADFTDENNSAGVEIVFDNQFWNELPVSFGIRNSYLLTEDQNRYQLSFFVKSFIVE